MWRRNQKPQSQPSNQPSDDDTIDVVGVRISHQDAALSLPVEQFAAVAKTLCGFPSFFAAPLFRRVRRQFGSRRLGRDGKVENSLPASLHRATGLGKTAASKPVPDFEASGGASTAFDSSNSSGDEAKHAEDSPPLASSSTKGSRGLSSNVWSSRMVLPPQTSYSDVANRKQLIPEDPVAENESQDVDTSGTVQLYTFLHYWREEMEQYDRVDRFFRLVAQRSAAPRNGGSRAIVPSDFMPFLEELLAFHPGLAFLETTPEFQEKYARTVIARIYYQLDHTASQLISPRMLRNSSLLAAFDTVDMEEDINLVNDFFSYEHFYVIYCKFWELDADHDFYLTRQDLNKLTDLTHTVLGTCSRDPLAPAPGPAACCSISSPCKCDNW